jgi:peptide/nickel transport system permease protein
MSASITTHSNIGGESWSNDWVDIELVDPDAGEKGYGRRLNWLTALGFLALGIVLAMAIIGPEVAPYNPNKPDPMVTLQGPSREHLMGTDQYGRDVFSRVLHAARLDLRVAISITAVALIVGSLIGGLIGFYGGALEHVVMRIIDVILAFPGFVLALGITAMLGNSTRNVIIAVAVAYIPYYVRLVRSEMLALREQEYASAAKVVGVRKIRILLYHLLPNALPIALAQATLNLGWGILDAAGLSFLGVGIRPPTAEWGVLVGEGAQYINSGQWWISVFPGVAILIAVLGFNLVGDWARDRFGPR